MLEIKTPMATYATVKMCFGLGPFLLMVFGNKIDFTEVHSVHQPYTSSMLGRSFYT